MKEIDYKYKSVRKILDCYHTALSEARTNGKQALSEAFKELFKEIPEIVKITFVGEQPFNDGDTTYFTLTEFNIEIDKVYANEWFEENLEQNTELCAICCGEAQEVETEHPRAIQVWSIIEDFYDATMSEFLAQELWGYEFAVEAFPDGTMKSV